MASLLLPEKPHGGPLRSGLGNGHNRTQAGVARHTLPPIHLARSTGLRRCQTVYYPTNPTHTVGSCAESLACARSGHHSLPPLSVGELPVSHRAHHRWDCVHPLLRLLPTERREEGMSTQRPAATRKGKQTVGRQKTPNAARRAPRNRAQAFLDSPTQTTDQPPDYGPEQARDRTDPLAVWRQPRPMTRSRPLISPARPMTP